MLRESIEEKRMNMKVKRTIKVKNPEKYQVGDIISFKLANGEKVEALAVKEENDNMLFCFVDCLEDEYHMNGTNTTEGGFETSNLNTYLNVKIIRLFPEKIKKNMVEFENEKYLRIPTEREIFGEAKYGNEPDNAEQWKPMKRRKNRIACLGKYGQLDWYWLSAVASSTNFCNCGTYGNANCIYASSANGVRPVFMLKNH